MIRQDIILNDYKYIIDFYKANQDIEANIYKKFVMFRRINITNSISYDTDIYIIEKDIFKEVFETIEDTDNLVFDDICFPMPNWGLTQFSASIIDLNKDFYYKSGDNAESFINRHGYLFYDNEGNEIPLLCDKIKIYHPSIIRSLQYIIYISNYINDINFHYYCRVSNNLPTYSESEFEVNNFKYSEYSEIYIPNIEYLFSTSKQNFDVKNVYFKENTSMVAEYDYGDNNVIQLSKEYKDLVPISLLIEPFEITKNEKYDLWVKKYIYIRKSIENNYLTYPINIFFYPYNSINSNNIYEFTDGIPANGDTFVSECKFSLSAKLGFDEQGVISIIGNFKYPSQSEFESIYNKQGLNKAYQLYNNISWTDYKNWDINNFDYENIDNTEGYIEFHNFIINNISKINYKEDDTNTPETYEVILFDTTTNNIVNTVNYKSILNKDVIIKISKGGITYLYVIINIDYDSNEYTIKPYSEDCVKIVDKNENLNIYLINTSTNIASLEKELVRLKNEINKNPVNIKDLQNQYNITNGTLYKYKFAHKKIQNLLFSIVNNVQLNLNNNSSEIYLIGYKITIASDFNFKNVIYTLKNEESFNTEEEKDIIYNFAFNLNNLFSSWDEMPEILVSKIEFIDRLLGVKISSNFVPITKEWYKYMINDINKHYINLSKYSSEIVNMDIGNNNSTIKFIDKINCTINKVVNESNVDGLKYTNISPKIIYKPIFYKTQTLNTLKIKSNISQNVGINLNEYLTKVETFKLIIEDTVYVETGRNDVYVIFRINPSDFTETSGSYIISNQDDDYISDGTYTVY